MTGGLWHLKSGTDIRGRAIAAEGAEVQLTEEIGVLIGRAFAAWLSDKLQKPADALCVYLGRDSRLSGEKLLAALAQGLCDGGVSVYDTGLCTTPAMFMTTKLAGADGAVMVTASHMPMQYNGYKFFTASSGLEGADIAQILAVAADMPKGERAGCITKANFLLDYRAFLADMVKSVLDGEKPLSGLHVAVDAGNGAGGFYADFLASLGADTEGSQFLAPDGRFPNHIPNPEDGAAMEAISGAVLRAGADLGVIFDADCDRAALVDEKGRPINRNRLIALASSILLAQTPGATIVCDSVTSAGLEAFISARGGHLYRYRRGYRNVINKAIEINKSGTYCPLAIETSGHAALLENHFLDDGMYLATRLIIEAMRKKREGRKLCSLIEALKEPLESTELRLPIVAENFRDVGEAVVQAITLLEGYTIDRDNHEGIRMWLGSPERWFLLRLSVHDPLLVLNAESDEKGGLLRIIKGILPTLLEYPQVDVSAIHSYLHKEAYS